MAAILGPLAERIARHARAGAALHADQTPVPVLDPGRGRTKTDRLWTAVRDEKAPRDRRRRRRPSTSTRPIAGPSAPTPCSRAVATISMPIPTQASPGFMKALP
jgi:Transposase IS66 family